MYWEFAGYQGQQAVRINQWKGIRKDIRKGNLDIELYNLDEDIKEENNVASEHPDVVERMRVMMTREHTTATIDRFKLEALGDSD